MVPDFFKCGIQSIVLANIRKEEEIVQGRQIKWPAVFFFFLPEAAIFEQVHVSSKHFGHQCQSCNGEMVIAWSLCGNGDTIPLTYSHLPFISPKQYLHIS